MPQPPFGGRRFGGSYTVPLLNKLYAYYFVSLKGRGLSATYR